jgi:hypothetical protein
MMIYNSIVEAVTEGKVNKFCDKLKAKTFAFGAVVESKG